MRPSATEPEHEHADLRYFLATANPDAIAPENEHSPLRWLALDEARDLVGGNNLRHALDRADAVLLALAMSRRRGVRRAHSRAELECPAAHRGLGLVRGLQRQARRRRPGAHVGCRRFRLRGVNGQDQENSCRSRWSIASPSVQVARTGTGLSSRAVARPAR